MLSRVRVMKTASCRKIEKSCIQKQGRTQVELPGCTGHRVQDVFFVSFMQNIVFDTPSLDEKYEWSYARTPGHFLSRSAPDKKPKLIRPSASRSYVQRVALFLIPSRCLEGEFLRSVKMLPRVRVLEIASSRNIERCKRELRASGWTFLVTRRCFEGEYWRSRFCHTLDSSKQPLAETWKNIAYKRPKVIGPCASGSYDHWVALF